MNFTVGAKSDVGQVREGNEDAYLVEAPLFVVADGMGGHLAGDVASSTAVEIISERSRTASTDDPETLAGLLREANTAIWEKSRADKSLRGMGTTCTLLSLDDQRAHIAHVGDSRAYLLRDGNLQQLTEDHTLVGRMVREGRLRPEEAHHHPQRSIITRALGVDAEVNVDLQTLALKPGDRLLLCSDGLSSMLDSDTIRRALESNVDAQGIAEQLVDMANGAGGDDNITVVVVDIGRERSAGPPPAPRGRTTVPPARSDTDPNPPRPGRNRGSLASWGRIAAAVLILLAIAGATVAGTRYLLRNSWFVGVDGTKAVTIFQGIPEQIAGLDLKEAKRKAGITLRDLPPYKRDLVTEGIKVESLQEARTTVTKLRALAEDYQAINQKRTNRKNTKQEKS